MFVVTEADAAAIRAVFDQEGELSGCYRIAPPVPRHHRQRQGSGMRPGDCRMATDRRAAAEVYDPVARHPIVGSLPSWV
jgi:hypothetical protein